MILWAESEGLDQTANALAKLVRIWSIINSGPLAYDKIDVFNPENRVESRSKRHYET